MRVHQFSRILGAVALLAASGPLLAQEAARGPESDIGLDQPAYPPAPAPRYSDRAEQVGPTTGDPEKDSIGFVLLTDAPAEMPGRQSAEAR